MEPNNRLNILIIDDDEDDYFIISTFFNAIAEYNIVPTWCNSYNKAIELLVTQKFDLSFVDYRLGAKSGIDLIEKAIQSDVSIPIIILTGKGNPEIDRMAVNKGAYDYLIKGEISSESLERSIRYALARYESKKALQQSEKKFRSIYEHSKDAMFILTENFDILDVNEATVNLLNITKKKLIGTSALTIFKNKKIRDLGKRLYVSNEIDEEEVQITVNNNEYTGLLSITKEKDNDNKVYLQGVFHDITHLKKAEQSKLQAEKYEAGQRFVRMLAHEVRNPLNNIMLALDAFNEGEPEDEQVYLDIVRRNSVRINDIIKQLLSSFKVSEIERSTISIEDLMQDALTAINDKVMLKGIKLQKNIDLNLLIHADAEKLKLSILNFLVNAIEAMEQDKGVLSISAIKNDNHIILSIEDNGCGMNEEQVQHLFEPYFTTKKNGVGLGLSSSLGILRLHNAVVNVHSQLHKGTTFTIMFKV